MNKDYFHKMETKGNFHYNNLVQPDLMDGDDVVTVLSRVMLLYLTDLYSHQLRKAKNLETPKMPVMAESIAPLSCEQWTSYYNFFRQQKLKPH